MRLEDSPQQETWPKAKLGHRRWEESPRRNFVITYMSMNIVTYLKEVRVELTKVTWPTRAQATHLTIIILAASLAVGLYIGGLDFVFTSLLGTILK